MVRTFTSGELGRTHVDSLESISVGRLGRLRYYILFYFVLLIIYFIILF